MSQPTQPTITHVDPKFPLLSDPLARSDCGTLLHLLDFTRGEITCLPKPGEHGFYDIGDNTFYFQGQQISYRDISAQLDDKTTKALQMLGIDINDDKTCAEYMEAYTESRKALDLMSAWAVRA